MQVLTIERSAEAFIGVITVEVLFPGMGSGVVLLTLAVLAIVPLTLLLTIPRRRIVTVLFKVMVPTL